MSHASGRRAQDHLVYSTEHVTFSLTRLIGSLIMGAVMTLVMLGFMGAMYEGRTLKVVVLWAALVLAGVLSWLNRSQRLVGDTAFMSAMIPHHSIAINNARKATLTDPRVRALADRIIASQVREIREMELLIEDLRTNGSRGTKALPARPAEITPEMEAQAREAVR